MTRFPTVGGSNLDGRDFTLPTDFGGEVNLLFIAFQRGQQAYVDTWLPIARELEASDMGFRAYELPTIAKLNPFTRWMIHHGMSSGIKDPWARASTITLHLDKEAFRRELAIEREDEITLLLVRRDGTVLWRETGVAGPEKEASLRKAIAESGARVP